MQPKESSAGKAGETREAIVFKIAEDMLRKLPRDYVPHEVKDALIRLGGLLPMNIFLRQEIDRMQKIITLGKVYGSCYPTTLLGYHISILNMLCFSTNQLDRYEVSYRRYHCHECGYQKHT